VTNGDQAVTLQSITLASDFAQSGVVFVAARANDTDKTTLRIMRMREAGGALGEAATIASEPIAVDGTAVLRTAPDGLLFVGIGAGSMATQAQTLSDAAGKILRLRHDGSAPDDNPWRSLVFSLGHHSPSGLAWHPSTRALFEVERNEIADEVNTIRAGANYGWPVTRSQLSRISGPIVVLPAETGPSGATFVAREDSPLFGDLIVSATGAADLLRVHVDADGRGRIVDQLLQRRFGRIGQVIAADGSLYIITANTDTWGSGHDLLIRVTAGAR
jgi:glucose/arabinose dehydrogenase